MTWTRRLRLAVLTAIASLVFVGCLVQPHRATPLGPVAALTFVDGRPADPGEPGTRVLDYEHRGEISLGFTVTAQPGRSLVLTGLRLDGTEAFLVSTLDASADGSALPVHLAGGQRAAVTVRTRLDGCPSQGDREAETMAAVVVDLVNAGRPETWRLPIDGALVIRRPVGCRLS